LIPLFATCVIDTGGIFAAGVGVVDTGGKFAASVVDTGGKFATGINNTRKTGGKFYLRISPQIFEKIRNVINGILWGWGKTDS
jgi:hypothetical protein